MVKKRDVNFWNRLNKYVRFNFKLSLEYLKKIRNYVLFSLVLFLIFVIVGFGFPIFFKEQIIRLISDLIKQTEGLGAFGLIRFIIANNIQSSFFGVIFGVVFGIFPLMIIIVNGYILGFVANQAAMVNGSLVLWRLLPHGIFEIPAIMIAVGAGFRLGMFLFTSGEKNWKRFKKEFINALRIFILIVIPLLVVAGIVEGLLIFLIK